MKENYNKKGLAVEKLLLIILMLIVLVSVLAFIFRADILQWMNNLPSYQAGEDKQIDVNALQDATGLSSLCPIRIGQIVNNKIILYDLNILTAKFGRTPRETSLRIDGTNINVIRYVENFGEQIVERNFGYIQTQTRQIFLKNSYTVVDGKSTLTFTYDPSSGPYMPPLKQLILLNGATINRNNDLCRRQNEVDNVIKTLKMQGLS